MAMKSGLRFAAGDTLIIGGDTGDRRWLTVVKSRRNGYLLRSNDGADDRTWPHDEIYDLYVAGTLEHFPLNLQALDGRLASMLQADWESWSPELQFQARCHEQFCLHVDKLRARGVKLMPAYARAARTIHRRNKVKWTAQANSLAGAQEKERRERARKAVSTLEECEEVKLEQPSQYAVRSWYQQWVKAGRDVRALIPKYHYRGDRSPRKTSKLHLQTDESRPLCVYGAMKYIARKIYMKIPRVPVMHAYRELVKMCERDGFDPVSHTTFYAFIYKHFTDFEEYKARHGWKAAFYKYHLFQRREAPERPLEEVEVDHTLLDVFVRDAKGRVGRPWLTLLICRTTRCVVGLHIGFDVPSYATLQRAVVHAICPKDLRAIPGIKNDWPCHGVMDCIITDRGLEFLSESFLAAGRDVGFAVVNLPGRCPYLKGAVERFFGSINVRVLSHIEGTTISRTDQVYDPQAKARYSLAEITTEILKWIVDDYHQKKHDAIGCSPAERWDEVVDLYKVRPIKSFRGLVTLLGETVRRQVQNTGVLWEGHTYRSQELEQLRKRRGGLKKPWQIRCDPYDRGEIWVLDDQRKRWISVPAVHQQTARGVSKYRSRVHLRLARQLVPDGELLTDAIMVEAMRIADEQADQGTSRQVLRYLAEGSLATQVYGNIGISVILGGTSDPTVAVDAPISNDTDVPASSQPTHEVAPLAPKTTDQPKRSNDDAWSRLLNARLGDTQEAA